MKDKPPTKLSLHAARMVNLEQILLLPAHLIYLEQMIKLPLQVWVPTQRPWAGAQAFRGRPADLWSGLRSAAPQTETRPPS